MPSRNQLRSPADISATRLGRPRHMALTLRLARVAAFTIVVQFASVAVALLTINTHDALAATNTASFQVGITIGGPQSVRPKVNAPRKPRYTWGAAEISLRRGGFTVLGRLSKSGDFYWFEAENSEGQVRAAVSVTSGEIVSSAP